ncbi:MAG: 50S ribosomal protein L1 [Candidatus Heimdallarchaeota archaeon]
MSFSATQIHQAISKAKELGAERKRKFTETLEISVGLRNIDLKNPSNRFNFEVRLPHDLREDVRVAVFADGDLATRAGNLGLRIVGRDELEALGKDPKGAKKLANSHDFFVAMAPFMPLIGRFLGKILGPRAKMPKPIPPAFRDLEGLISNYKRTVVLRVKNQPVVCVPVGKVSSSEDDLTENASVIIQSLLGKLERGQQQIKKISFKTTMGPSVIAS